MASTNTEIEMRRIVASLRLSHRAHSSCGSIIAKKQWLRKREPLAARKRTQRRARSSARGNARLRRRGPSKTIVPKAHTLVNETVSRDVIDSILKLSHRQMRLAGISGCKM